jgi:predicted SprT family Zn-dependent metalloprotease
MAVRIIHQSTTSVKTEYPPTYHFYCEKEGEHQEFEFIERKGKWEVYRCTSCGHEVKYACS